MVSYYIIVTAVNVLFFAIYFSKLNKTYFSSKTIILITSLSLFLSFIFPKVYTYLNANLAILVILLFIVIGGFYIAKYDKYISKVNMGFSNNDFVIMDMQKLAEETSISTEPPALEESNIKEEVNPSTVIKTEFEGENMRFLNEQKIDSLNTYINKGFESKTENKLDDAIMFFLKALEFPVALDLELMLVFDICTLSKEIGKYDLAIDTLNKCLKKNSTILSSSNLKEISLNLKYLEYLQEILVKVNTPNLSISKIPTIIKVSVDNKINEWKKETF